MGQPSAHQGGIVALGIVADTENVGRLVGCWLRRRRPKALIDPKGQIAHLARGNAQFLLQIGHLAFGNDRQPGRGQRPTQHPARHRGSRLVQAHRQKDERRLQPAPPSQQRQVNAQRVGRRNTDRTAIQLRQRRRVQQVAQDADIETQRGRQFAPQAGQGGPAVQL